MSVKNIYTGTLFFIIGLFCTCALLNADDLDNVLMPDANVICRINIQNINNSSIVKYIKSSESISSELKVDELNTILKKYNLSDKDFISFAFGLKINADKIENINEGLSDDKAKEFIFGLSSTKEISLETLKRIILDASKEDGSNDVKVSAEKKGDIDLLIVTDNDKAKEQPLAVTVIPCKKLIIGGLTQTVIDSVKRINAKKSDTFSAEINQIKSQVSNNADVYLIGCISNDLRKKLGLTQTSPKKKSDQGPSPESLKDINAILVEAVFQKELSVNLIAYFINKSSADEGSQFVNQYIPMLKFMVLGMTKGNQLPLLNTIACSVIDSKPQVKLHFSITEKDINSIQKLIKQNESNENVNEQQGLSELEN